MGKKSSKGKYVEKINGLDIYVSTMSKPDSTKKHGYSMTYDYRIYKYGKLITKGLKSKESAISESLKLSTNKLN